MRMFGSSGLESAGQLSMPRTYSSALLAPGRSSLKSAEAPGRSRNVSGPHLFWKRGNLSLFAVRSRFDALEVHLISALFVPYLSRRYLEESGCTSCTCVSSSDSLEPLPYLDSWKSRHLYWIIIPSYSATLPFRGNLKVRWAYSVTAVSLTVCLESCMLWTFSYSWYTWHCFQITPFTPQNARLSSRA
jgi:hypothetical protein